MNINDLKNARLLGQLRPANTTAASLYSPSVGLVASITAVDIVNTTGGAVTYRLFIDIDGTTYDETTAIGGFDTSLAANTRKLIEWPEPGLILVGKDSGNLAVRTSSGNALTFTAIGYEIR